MALSTTIMTTSEMSDLTASIVRLEARQEEHIERNDDAHDTLDAKYGELRTMLTGNGEVGFSERLRNVERVAASVISWGRWIKFGVAGLVVKALWDVIQEQGTVT